MIKKKFIILFSVAAITLHASRTKLKYFSKSARLQVLQNSADMYEKRKNSLRTLILQALFEKKDINRPLSTHLGTGDDAEPPLLRIASDDDLNDLVQLLLQAGADITKERKDVFFPYNALHAAARRGAHQNIKTMLNYLKANDYKLFNHLLKSNVNYESLLHGAVVYGHYRAVKVLLRFGAQIVHDRWGTTPLHLAASNVFHKHFKCMKKIVIALCAYGARVDETNHKNETVIDFAKNEDGEYAQNFIELLYKLADLNKFQNIATNQDNYFAILPKELTVLLGQYIIGHKFPRMIYY